MNPCKEISAHSVHGQLDSIAEQVAAELQQYHSGGGEQEAKSSASDDSKVDHSRSSTCIEVGDSTKDHDRVNTTAAGCERVRGLQLPTEVVLDGINTVLYSRLRFSAPSMEQYYNLENSFIDKVWEWDISLRCHENAESAKRLLFCLYFPGIPIFRYWHRRKVCPSQCVSSTRQWLEDLESPSER